MDREEHERCAVYVASSESRQLHVWYIDDLNLRLLQMIDVEDMVKTMAIHPSKTSLYVGTREKNKLMSFTVDVDGLLRKGGEVDLDSSPSCLSVDPGGSAVYVVSYSGGSLGFSDIGKDGSPGVNTVLIDNLDRCHAVKVNDSGNRLWVTCLGEDSTRVYAIGRDDTLTPPNLTHLGRIKTRSGSGPRHIELHRNGRFAYILNEVSATVDVVEIGDVLRISRTVGVVPERSGETCGWTSDIHMTRDGRWLYCCDRGTNTIAQFAVLRGGADLRLVDRLTTAGQPRSFDLDDRGRYLVVSGERSGDFYLYEIDRFTGCLVFKRRCLVGKRPMWVSILGLTREARSRRCHPLSSPRRKFSS